MMGDVVRLPQDLELVKRVRLLADLAELRLRWGWPQSLAIQWMMHAAGSASTRCLTDEARGWRRLGEL